MHATPNPAVILGAFTATYTLDLFDQSDISVAGSLGTLELTLQERVSTFIPDKRPVGALPRSGAAGNRVIDR